MLRQSLVILALFSFGVAHAATDTTAKANYQAAVKSAKAAYSADKKLCADLDTGSARLTCLKDAKAKYNAAIKTAKAEMKNGAAQKAVAGNGGVGKVLGVSVAEKEGEGGPVGLIAGGVAGAVLGNQVGGGTGKDLATIAGAAGGAYAGHKIEQKMKATKVWTVRVRFENGEEHSFAFKNDPGMAAGETVVRSGNSIVRR